MSEQMREALANLRKAEAHLNAAISNFGGHGSPGFIVTRSAYDLLGAADKALAPAEKREPVAWMFRYEGCVTGPIETSQDLLLSRAVHQGWKGELVPLYAAPPTEAKEK